ncbi:MAG: helix-turn-helix transcriptional regulator [Sphingomonadales bacterium]
MSSARKRLGEVPAATDDLISLIYRGPLEPTPWLSFLKELGNRLDCRAAGIVLRLSGQGRPPVLIWGRRATLSEADAAAVQEAHARLGHLDPLRNALTRPGAIHSLSDVITREALHENEFYQQVMRPHGIEYELGMFISEPGGWECNVGLTNDSNRGDFDQFDRDFLAALRPHLEQALALYSQINRYGAELNAIVETLDRLTISTVILSGGGKIIRSNGAARRLAETGGMLRIVDNTLSILNRAENAQLQALITKAIEATRNNKAQAFAEGMRVTSDMDQFMGVLVRAISPPTPFTNDASPAVIIYFAGGGAEQPIERLVAQIFDLTPSEAQLATLLATGHTLTQAAEKLELKESSVRTYCKAILTKVGVNRQTDLVRLILRSVAVLG